MYRLEKAIATAMTEGSHIPTPDELAQNLGVSVKEIQTLLQANADNYSLNAELDDITRQRRNVLGRLSQEVSVSGTHATLGLRLERASANAAALGVQGLISQDFERIAAAIVRRLGDTAEAPTFTKVEQQTDTAGRAGMVRRDGTLTPVPAGFKSRPFDFGQGPVDGPDDVGDRHLVRRTGEPVPAAGMVTAPRASPTVASAEGSVDADRAVLPAAARLLTETDWIAARDVANAREPPP